ncbi:hypothetical protein VII00023_20372 [Vibrio ichthyoenteri ATCC 700023]|uniref:Uncharacterized protein n=1 Tax=Vibrio ichthyoenteri ATCC 700023 TaxID=870968 RepID=F9RXK6_9VIBR|nr:hypothetical protein [Vibrio ichthyoenteri]EGU47786.1 hypothetical protein VII00023_20372 [Vibrio ichthyoenteri ATCC 700023]
MARAYNVGSSSFGRTTSHNSKHLELLKSSVHQLSPSQLRELRGVINSKLNDVNQVRITEEEQRLINSLF